MAGPERDIGHPFDRLIENREAEYRLAEAALWFATDFSPGMAPDDYLSRLDSLADRVARMGASEPYEQVAALRHVLVEQEGYTGNVEEFYDPRNSLLNQVMDRRLGLPISLCVIWLDIAEQLHWPFYGVALPGHFILKREEDGGPGRLLVDPFHGGRVLDETDCEELMRTISGHDMLLTDDMLESATKRATLFRMLLNMNTIFTRGEQWAALHKVVQRMIALEPQSEDLTKQLYLVRLQLGRMN